MAIVGPSGSGKTTLLNLIGALDVPTGGRIAVFGRDLGPLSRSERAELRLRSLGLCVPGLQLGAGVDGREENVEFVLELQGMDPKKRRARAEETLAELGARRASRPAAQPDVGRPAAASGRGAGRGLAAGFGAGPTSRRPTSTATTHRRFCR